MKYILAYLLCMGLAYGIKAQTKDSLSNDPGYSCYYIDENSFQCDRREELDIDKNQQLKKDSRPEREKKFNPDKENLDKSKNTPKEVQQKYTKPEKESDSGILDAGSVEVDSSTIIKQSGIDNHNPLPNSRINEAPVTTAGKEH